MSPFDGGSQQASALIVRPADLREPERLDTRAVYLHQRCFRISQARSVDHDRVELRNPGEIYRRIRFGSSPLGPDRIEVNYRNPREDPLTASTTPW